MRQDVRHQLWILAVGVLVFFTNLGAARLWDQDEAYFSRTAVEMHERGEWVVPYFNDDVFAHKPPVMYWLMRVGFMLFGVTEFAARFWSAVFGLATALLVYRLGRHMFNANVGLWAGLAMTTALMFDVVARAATPDSFLVFFSMLVLYVFAAGENWRDQQEADDAERLPGFTPLPWANCVLMYGAAAIAVLVKGPIGLVLPGGVIGLYLLTRDRMPLPTVKMEWSERYVRQLTRFSPIRILAAMWAMRPLTATFMLLLVAGPWFLLVGLRTDGQFLSEFFGEQNFGRFASPMDNHSGGIWYYIPAILVGFFPWSIFGIPTALELGRRCAGRDQETNSAKFVACWIILYVVFFSLAGTKLPSYVLPAYPGLALATAMFIDRWQMRPRTVHRRWPRLSFGSMLLVGLAAIAISWSLSGNNASGQPRLADFGVSPHLQEDFKLISLLGAVLAAGGVIALILAEAQRRKLALVGAAATAVMFSLTLFAGIAVRVDRHQPSPAVAEAIRRHSSGAPRVAQFGYFRPSLVYYAGTRVQRCKNPGSVADFLTHTDDSFVVTTDDHYARMAALLPGDVTVVDRRPEFPGNGTVLVLKRQTELAHREAKTAR